MEWFENATSDEFFLIWKEGFADSKALFAGRQRDEASDRAYRKDRALWVEVREPLDGVRLITLELPLQVHPARVYLRAWTYHPSGDEVYETIATLPFLWEAKPLPRYRDERPKPSWQSQLDAEGVQLKGIRYYFDLSPYSESKASEIVVLVKKALESLCNFVADAVVSPNLESVAGRTSAAVRIEDQMVDTSPSSLLAAGVESIIQVPTTEPPAAVVSDLVGLEHDQRFRSVPPPMRMALANARVGQGGYRQRMLELWGRGCALTGCEVEAVLIASHARPWSSCETAEQCLDEYNGILLSATLDRLFDQGLMAFSDEGKVLTKGGSAIQALIPRDRLRFVDRRHIPYLTWHRIHFGFQ